MASSLFDNLDSDDYDSDEEVDAPCDVDYLEDEQLELIGWYAPLGSRILSSISGLDEIILKEYLKTTLVTPEKSTFQDIETYFQNSQCHHFKMEMKRVIKINRYDEWTNGCGYEKENMKLLWHGTKKERVGSILKNGFCRPKQSAIAKQMFGNGVYFADRVSKSAQYCDGTEIGKTGYIFLCAVNLGNMFMCLSPLNDYNAPPSDYHSIMGVGKYAPDSKEIKHYHKYVIPCGKTVANVQNFNIPLQYNEYIVYDLNRISIKFLIEFEIV